MFQAHVLSAVVGILLVSACIIAYQGSYVRFPTCIRKFYIQYNISSNATVPPLVSDRHSHVPRWNTSISPRKWNQLDVPYNASGTKNVMLPQAISELLHFRVRERLQLGPVSAGCHFDQISMKHARGALQWRSSFAIVMRSVCIYSVLVC